MWTDTKILVCHIYLRTLSLCNKLHTESLNSSYLCIFCFYFIFLFTYPVYLDSNHAFTFGILDDSQCNLHIISFQLKLFPDMTGCFPDINKCRDQLVV